MSDDRISMFARSREFENFFYLTKLNSFSSAGCEIIKLEGLDYYIISVQPTQLSRTVKWHANRAFLSTYLSRKFLNPLL